jgi:VWFA-related protein
MQVRRTLDTAIQLLVLAGAGWAIFPLPAQPSQQDSEAPVRLRADARVVEIVVSARDPQGLPVEDLRASDFTVTDNGKPRAFTIFSVNRDTSAHPPAASPGAPSDDAPTLPARPALPPNVFTNAGSSPPPAGHSTVILLDGVNGWFDNFDMARKGVLGLLAKAPADEKIALYVSVKGVGMVVLQDYTLDRRKLEAAIAKYIPRGMSPAPPYMPEGAEGMMDPLEDGPAVFQKSLDAEGFASAGDKQLSVRVAAEDVRKSLNILAEKLKSVPGRKSIFWVTQGFPPSQIRNGNQSNWNRTLSNLNDANVEVNTVDSNGLGGPPRFWGPGAILTMQQLAERTGGKAYYHRNDLDAALASGIAGSRSSYTLGFYLTNLDGKYHELRVNADRPGLQLTYRRGYYAQDETVREPADKKSSLEAALLSPIDSTDVGITARFDLIPAKPRDTLNARLTLAPESLSIKRTRTGYTCKIEVMILELDADGHGLGRFSDTRQFPIDEAGKQRLAARGLTFSKAVPKLARAAKLLIVVRDSASGRVGSLAVPMEQLSARPRSN